MSKGYDFSGASEDQTIWTKEQKRVEQITKKEDAINYYKELGQWDLVLNALEDYLRFQVEAIEEKEPETKKIVKGIYTPTYKKQNEEIINLQLEWSRLQRGKSDPAARRNDLEDKFDLIMRIKRMIDRIYQNNIEFNLTYRKAQRPEDAWMEE